MKEEKNGHWNIKTKKKLKEWTKKKVKEKKQCLTSKNIQNRKNLVVEVKQ